MNMRQDFAEIRVEENFNLFAARRDHAFEHARVSGFGQGLEFFPEVAVVPVGADGNTPADGGIQLLRVPLPLLERIAFEKFLIQFPAYLAEDDLFRVGGIFDRHALGFQPCFHFLRGGGAPDDLLEGVQVDWEIPIPTFAVGEDPVIHGMPFGELAEVILDFWRIGPEIVRAVGVDEHAVVVILIVGIAADVVAFFHHE